MRKRLWTITAGAAVLAALALAGATLAAGGSSAVKKKSATTTTGTLPAPTLATRTPETPLTGDVLAKVTAAAIAKAGGTVDMATTESDSSNSAAAYEAHVTKADGTHVTVILDKDYNVLAVETGGHGGFGPGGPGGPGGNGETPLTGDVATKAKAAAVAKTGGTADFATTENDSSNTAAAYEVHVTKADGTHARVILDKDYNVLGVETGGPGFGPGGRGGPHGGPGGPGGSGETALTGDVAAKAKAAAVAKTGGTADFASTENDSSNAAAAYEVHVTKADGTRVSVILDKDYTVLTVETHAGP